MNNEGINRTLSLTRDNGNVAGKTSLCCFCNTMIEGVGLCDDCRDAMYGEDDTLFINDEGVVFHELEMVGIYSIIDNGFSVSDRINPDDMLKIFALCDCGEHVSKLKNIIGDIDYYEIICPHCGREWEESYNHLTKEVERYEIVGDIHYVKGAPVIDLHDTGDTIIPEKGDRFTFRLVPEAWVGGLPDGINVGGHRIRIRKILSDGAIIFEYVEHYIDGFEGIGRVRTSGHVIRELSYDEYLEREI